MKVLIILLVFFVTSNDALFGFFEGSKTTKAVTTTTTTTTTTTSPKPSQGREIIIPRTDEDEGGEVHIPFNERTTSTKSTTVTTTTRKPATDIPVLTRRPSPDEAARFTTTTRNPKFTAATKILPSSDRHSSSGCPNRIDAFTFGPIYDYAFYETTVYIIQNDRIIDRTTLEQEFPSGPKSVNGALYDIERETLFIVSEREVFGFKRNGGGWKLQSVFPKELPSNIPFTPDAAVRWYNNHQVLLSNGGQFALYDEYWNKSLLTGRTSTYFENLPDRVRGLSVWSNGRAHIFTQSLVFEYDYDQKHVVGEGKALGDFWKC